MEKLNIIPLLGGQNDFIKATKVEANQYEVFLDEDIGEPSEYRELISLLFNASELDSFSFYINTPGGQLNTTMAIIEGIKHCQAEVTGVLMGETHSGGSMIAMYCHNLAVLDSAEMMVHHASFGSYGSAGNVKTHSAFTVKRVEEIIEDAYEGFLTPEEIVEVKKGVELWFNAPEIRERMERRVELLTARAEAAAEEEESDATE